MRFLPKHLNPRGDTIVEVLIALAVVSSVLAGAFLVSQKSTLAVRDGQEHGELSQVLQGQVELVRSLALTETSDTTGVFRTSPSKYFCIDDVTNPAVPKPVYFAPLFTLPTVDTNNYPGYPPACKNQQGRYNIAITYDGGSTGSKVFTFTGRWDGIGGGKNQEQLVYRIYPGDAPVVSSTVTMPGGGSAPSNLADVVASTCQHNPDGSCVALGPTNYRWTSYVDNKSQIAAGVTIQSCTWKWADPKGTIVETQTNSCQPDNFQKHTWAIPPSTILPYAPNPNNSCFDFPGSVTLSLVLSDGSTPFKVYPVNYPNCS